MICCVTCKRVAWADSRAEQCVKANCKCHWDREDVIAFRQKELAKSKPVESDPRESEA